MLGIVVQVCKARVNGTQGCWTPEAHRLAILAEVNQLGCTGPGHQAQAIPVSFHVQFTVKKKQIHHVCSIYLCMGGSPQIQSVPHTKAGNLDNILSTLVSDVMLRSWHINIHLHSHNFQPNDV